MAGSWVLGEFIGAALMALSVVLLAVAGTASALVSGRSARPVPAARNRPIDRVEAVLFARYSRGEIDAAEYHEQLARAAEAIR